MSEYRFDFDATVWNGCLVAAGGFGHYSQLNTAELFVPCLNEWQKISPLLSRKDEHALVVADNNLYAIGGRDLEEGVTSSIVEKLDEPNGEWKRITSTNNPRRLFATVTCNSYCWKGTVAFL